MRISDWSSDVCSSDLDEQGQAYGKRASPGADAENFGIRSGRNGDQLKPSVAATADRGARRRHPRGIGGCRTDDTGEDRSKRELAGPAPVARFKIGRATGRDRVCQYV